MTQRHERAGERLRLMQEAGRDTARFQELSYAFDDAAAEVLALDRRDLPILTLLLFHGPASDGDIARLLQLSAKAIDTTLERLQVAGYARMQPGRTGRIELTGHAREWIERIWAPLREDGIRLLGQLTTKDLRTVTAFMREACAMSEARGRKLRSWLTTPASRARSPHLRGGLSPAALRRVQVFVEANLGRPIRLQDLAARAGLSPFHFARAFKTTAGLTPRGYVEQRRVERARHELRETEHPLAAIAAETGFGTQSRLTTTFKRQTGFTPAAYRRGRR